MKGHPNRILRRNKKGALELSMNTIVVIVIGVTILTLGLRWVYNLFGGLQERSGEIDEQLKKQISDLFEGGEEALIIRPNSVTIEQRGGKDIVIAIRNSARDGLKHTYSYSIRLTNTEDIAADAQEVMGWITSGEGEQIEIDSGNIAYELVAIDIPRDAPLGTYRFDVSLSSDDLSANTKANFLVRIRGE